MPTYGIAEWNHEAAIEHLAWLDLLYLGYRAEAGDPVWKLAVQDRKAGRQRDLRYYLTGRF